jgi:hypothetical protein
MATFGDSFAPSPSISARTVTAEDVPEEWRTQFDGRGFTLGTGLVAIELTQGRNPLTGQLTPWAQQLVDLFASRTEIAANGVDVVIFVGVTPALSARPALSEQRPEGGCITLHTHGHYLPINSPLHGSVFAIESKTATFEVIYDSLAAKVKARQACIAITISLTTPVLRHPYSTPP